MTTAKKWEYESDKITDIFHSGGAFINKPIPLFLIRALFVLIFVLFCLFYSKCVSGIAASIWNMIYKTAGGGDLVYTFMTTTFLTLCVAVYMIFSLISKRKMSILFLAFPFIDYIVARLFYIKLIDGFNLGQDGTADILCLMLDIVLYSAIKFVFENLLLQGDKK